MYAVALGCDINRRLTSVSTTGINFNIGKTFMEFSSTNAAKEFICRWKGLTSWNWDTYSVVRIDEKGESCKL